MDYLDTLRAAIDAHDETAVMALAAFAPYPEAGGALPRRRL